MPGGRITHHDAPYWRTMREAEHQILTFYLDEANGNVSNAAILMGMERSWVYKRLRKLGISFSKKPRTGTKYKTKTKSKSKKPKKSKPLHLRLVVPDDDKDAAPPAAAPVPEATPPAAAPVPEATPPAAAPVPEATPPAAPEAAPPAAPEAAAPLQAIPNNAPTPSFIKSETPNDQENHTGIDDTDRDPPASDAG